MSSRTVPSQLTVACPKCGTAADFWFATFVDVGKANAHYFSQSKDFELVRGRYSHGSNFTAALYFPGLSSALENINDLPSGLEATNWESRKYRSNVINGDRLGAIQCSHCLVPTKHQLRWPDDAYFQITYKDQKLWAYDRATCQLLLDFVESETREKRVTGFIPGKQPIEIISEHSFLRRIPKIFLSAKARPNVSKKLRKLLRLPPKTSSTG